MLERADATYPSARIENLAVQSIASMRQHAGVAYYHRVGHIFGSLILLSDGESGWRGGGGSAAVA